MVAEPLQPVVVKLPRGKKIAFEAYLRSRGTNASVYLRQAIYDLLDRVERGDGEDQLTLKLHER